MQSPTNSADKRIWLDHLRAEHGELVSGLPLRKLLGFRDADAFGKAAQESRTPVAVFKIKGRRGWFALPQNLADWLVSIGASAPE